MGGVQALLRLASTLPADLPAAVLIVQHIGRSRSVLPELLSRSGPLPARHGIDDEPIVCGRIYVAPPDHHMRVGDGRHARAEGAPHPPGHRPAVPHPTLSRDSAGVGVVLTGRLDDGTAGLQAIKACGGIAVVQDPAEAAEPSMRPARWPTSTWITAWP